MYETRLKDRDFPLRLLRAVIELSMVNVLYASTFIQKWIQVKNSWMDPCA
jgi:hypothetical protein